MAKERRNWSYESQNPSLSRFLPGQNEICSYVLIGDEAFALEPYLMRPFPYKQTLTVVRKEKYNVRLCRARRVVENAFGILCQKWRIFYRPLETKVDTTILIMARHRPTTLTAMLLVLPVHRHPVFAIDKKARR
ncbi:unnamed protein product [Acanthoscelides obtectus]|uniref:DDE Tnp4 domain-containing protein n=1 Tax=Acanthoscelides obtectus TaxID=200917 RepID=A0A9P0KHE6_ACAOB|nr:unnamed protein product [Acanthoscelides obtectus]CAK1651961.1 hypothetical protein AOBTE_LOCUS17578 [Acanthoscelides obtectus]